MSKQIFSSPYFAGVCFPKKTGHRKSRCAKPETCPQCGNMVQNHSFESGLAFWNTDNVTTGNGDPAEGTQVAILGPDVASISQDIRLSIKQRHPLLLSLIAYRDSETYAGNFTLQVLWLDNRHNILANGLQAFISSRIFADTARITYFDITDHPSAEAAFVRILISKGASNPGPDRIAIDQVILAPVGTTNLVQNSSFEAGLSKWTSTGFVMESFDVWEGAAAASIPGQGTLFQDIAVNPLLRGSSFLLSFAVRAKLASSLSVRLIWQDEAGNQIGPAGLDLSIPGATLNSQGNYLSYLEISEPAPIEAVTARILFITTPGQADTKLSIDKVLLVRVETQNLVQNPSFENNLDNWTAFNTNPHVTNSAYEGDKDAFIAQVGGVIFQDIPLSHAKGHCYLLNFGLGYGGGQFPNGDVIVKLLWLNEAGREIGLGLSLIIPLFILQKREWLVYSGITEAAPECTAGARIQFTKSAGGTGGFIGVDKVVLGRLV